MNQRTEVRCQKTEDRSKQRIVVSLVALTLYAPTCFAASVISTIDGGGGRSTSTSYAMDGSLGGIGTDSSSAAYSAKSGYAGQLTELVSISVTGTPATVNETSTAQLSGVANYDDATTAMLTGSDISWNTPAFPIASINSSGVATPSAVYQNTSGAFSGRYLGILNSGTLLVLDNNPDNYGIYASDHVPDWWQVQFFGVNNPNGVGSADVTGTGQNNMFKYVAGLDPTNPASVFVLRVANVTGQPTQKLLTFRPWATGRTYAPEYRTNLVSGSYGTLTGYAGPQTNSTEVRITDLNAVEPQKFYRIRITYP